MKSKIEKVKDCKKEIAYKFEVIRKNLNYIKMCLEQNLLDDKESKDLIFLRRELENCIEDHCERLRR